MFKYFILSIAILTFIFGKSFYAFKPFLILLSIPATSMMVKYKVSTRKSEKANIKFLLKQLLLPTKPNKPRKIQSPAIKLELIINLFSEFSSDTLAIMSIIQIAACTLLPISLVPSTFVAVITALVASLYIHLHHRLPEYEDYYTNIQQLFEPLKLGNASLEPIFKSLSIYSSFTLSVALYLFSPALGISGIVLTSALSIYHYRALIDTNFSIYVALVMQISTYAFIDKLSKLLLVARVIPPSKNLIALSSYLLAIPVLYVQYSGTQRNHKLKKAKIDVQNPPKPH